MSSIAGTTKNIKQVGSYDAVIMMLFLLYSIISQYTLLCIIAGFVFIVILKSLWKSYTPPVLLFFMSLHWLQVFSSVLFADFYGATIDEIFHSSGTEFLFMMTLLQMLIFVLFLAYNTIQKATNVKHSYERLRAASELINIKNVIIGYFASAVFVPLLQSFSSGSASLSQLVSTFGVIKIIFLCILVFVLLLNKKANKIIILSILLFDFVMSFASFFSDFKTILYVLVIVYFTVRPYITRVTIFKLLPIALAGFFFLSFWSYVKGDYREFLNQGTKSQVQTVSNSKALDYLFDQTATFGVDELRNGFSRLLARAQYMQRYSEVYNRVPSIIPHTNGKELYNSLEFVLVPRFLNANKGSKDASVKTSYYTGHRFSNASQGTSISMGYYCELFIDYGLYLMLIPLVFIALIIGYIYTLISNLKYNIILNYSILIGFFLTLGLFESDLIMFFGTLRNNLAFFIVGYYAIFPYINKFILEKR